MSFIGLDHEKNMDWRKGEYCISYPPKGSYATGTLHRPSCPTLKAEKRVSCYEPSKVYPETLERFTRDANGHGIGGQCKVCQHCCADLKITGHRMIQPPVKVPKAERLIELRFSLTRGEIDDFLSNKPGESDTLDKIKAALKAAK